MTGIDTKALALEKKNEMVASWMPVAGHNSSILWFVNGSSNDRLALSSVCDRNKHERQWSSFSLFYSIQMKDYY